MTIPENSRFGAAFGAGREGERLRPLPELAAAPITVVCLLETTCCLLTAAAPIADFLAGKGLLTSSPLAAAPMTNFLVGFGTSGNDVPAEPITNGSGSGGACSSTITILGGGGGGKNGTTG